MSAPVAPAARAIGPDLLRAAAILLVLLIHMPEAAVPPLFHWLRPYGWLGVDLFFVLSGYLIGGQLIAPIARGDAPKLGDFYIRRAFRILPAYLAVVAAYALFPVVREEQGMAELWRFLTFTMNFGLDKQVTPALSIAWSLCIEEHFYLVLPALVLFVRRMRTPAITIGLFAFVLIGGMVARGIAWNDVVAEFGGGNAQRLGHAYMTAIYFPTHMRLDGLLAGVALAALRTLRPEWRSAHLQGGRSLALACVALALALLLFTMRGTFAEAGPVMQTFAGAVIGYPLFALGCALLLNALLESEHRLRRVPLPGVRALALLAFSLYLTHKSVMHLDRLVLGEAALTGWAGFAIYLATSLGAAALLYALVERPFLRLRERLNRAAYFPRRFLWLSRSSTAFSDSGNSPSRRATS